MSTKAIDWKLDDTSLKKELLKLSKSELILLCKKEKVSTNGSKQDMINALIAKNKRKKQSNSNKRPKAVEKKKSMPPKLNQLVRAKSLELLQQPQDLSQQEQVQHQTTSENDNDNANTVSKTDCNASTLASTNNNSKNTSITDNTDKKEAPIATDPASIDKCADAESDYDSDEEWYDLDDEHLVPGYIRKLEEIDGKLSYAIPDGVII